MCPCVTDYCYSGHSELNVLVIIIIILQLALLYIVTLKCTVSLKLANCVCSMNWYSNNHLIYKASSKINFNVYVCTRFRDTLNGQETKFSIIFRVMFTYYSRLTIPVFVDMIRVPVDISKYVCLFYPFVSCTRVLCLTKWLTSPTRTAIDPSDESLAN